MAVDALVMQGARASTGMVLTQFAHISGLVQERHNSIANALELRLSCTNPSTWYHCLLPCIATEAADGPVPSDGVYKWNSLE